MTSDETLQMSVLTTVLDSSSIKATHGYTETIASYALAYSIVLRTIIQLKSFHLPNVFVGEEKMYSKLLMADVKG